jgi:hypothetical protein
MSAFPEITSVPFGNPVIQQLQFKTLITGFDDLGKEQRKQKWLYPRRLITLRYPYISKSEAETLFQFYIARSGAYQAFSFFYPSPRGNEYSYLHEYIGTGSSGIISFNGCSKYASNYTLYLDGVSQEETTDYTITAVSGPDGEDLITFVSAPSAGERITFSFTGRLKIRARFQDDKLNFEEFHDRLVNVGLSLQGLLNDE